MIPRKRKFLIASVAGISLSGLFHGNAYAAEDDPLQDVRVATIDAAEIDQNTASGAENFSAQGGHGTSVDEYLESQARAGNLVDIEQIQSATLADPLTEESIDLVWVDGINPTRVDRTEVEVGEHDSRSGMGVVVSQDEDSRSEEEQSVPGMGYSFAQPNGMYLQAYDCWGGFFTPNYPSVADNDHNMVSCYEKWAESGSRAWVYNRWGLWSKADPLIGRSSTIDYTLRSRPWAGTESAVASLNAWVPTSPSSQCNPGGTYGLEFGGVGVTVPINDCQNTQVLPHIGNKSMGIDWDGNSTAEQRGLDFAMHVTAQNTTIVPTFADYSWAEVRFCGISFCDPITNPGGSREYLHADSGW